MLITIFVCILWPESSHTTLAMKPKKKSFASLFHELLNTVIEYRDYVQEKKSLYTIFVRQHKGFFLEQIKETLKYI